MQHIIEGNSTQEAKELVKRFWSIIHLPAPDFVFNTALSENWETIKQAKQAAILHCELMQKTWSEDFYGLVLTPKFRERCLQKAEHYTNLITTIKSL